MEKIKVAIVGVGSISYWHINGYLNNPNVELYAFCDVNEKQLKAQGEKYNITRLYNSEDEMFEALPEIDAVSVCTWNNVHAECAIKALNAGKHVLCEKPMSINAELAKEMEEAAIRNGKKLVIGFVRRFGNDCDLIKDLMENDALGEIYYAKATYLRRNGSPGGWFGNKALSGGGPLIDLGVHVIDLIRYLCGNPKPVSVYGVTFNKLGDRREIKAVKTYVSVSKSEKDVCDVEDLASAMIRFDNGLVLQVETAFSLNRESKEMTNIELFGTKGGVSLDPELKVYTEWNGYLADVKLAYPTTLDIPKAFQAEIDEFVAVITGKGETRAPAEDGVMMMKILDAIYRSAETGHEVLIES